MTLRNSNEIMAHTFVKYDGTRRLRENFLDNEWLYINEETANKKTINYDNRISRTNMETLKKFLFIVSLNELAKELADIGFIAKQHHFMTFIVLILFTLKQLKLEVVTNTGRSLWYCSRTSHVRD